MKKSFLVFMFNILLYFVEIFPKMVINREKKRASKRSKESNVWFFLPSVTYSLRFLPWLKLDLQTGNDQRLTSVAQSKNKFHLTKYLFSNVECSVA